MLKQSYRLFFLFLSLLSLLLMTGCHKTTVNEQLDSIDLMLEQKDYIEARRHCVQLSSLMLENKDANPVEQLMRLALDYMVLADNDTSTLYEDDMAIASRLYGAAVAQAPDSVDNYALSIQNDKAAALELLQQILNYEKYSGTLEEIGVYEPLDSITEESLNPTEP